MEHREMERRREISSCGTTERQRWTRRGEMDRSCMERQYGPRSDRGSRRRQVRIKVRCHQPPIPPEPRFPRQRLRDPDPIRMRCKLIGEEGQCNATTVIEWDIFQEIARNR